MKKSPLIALLLVLLALLTACASGGGNRDESAPAAAKPAVSGVEKFKEGNKYGLRKGSEIIADAIWDVITEREVDGRFYYFVTLRGNPDRVGLILENGSMVVEPSWNFLSWQGEHVAVGFMKGDSKSYSLIDMDTGKTLAVSDAYVESVTGDYAILEKYGKSTTYGVLNIKTGKKLGDFPFAAVPRLIPGCGFLDDKSSKGTFMSLVNGRSVTGSHIACLEKEKLVLCDANGGRAVYDLKLNPLGSFVVFGDGYRTDDGRLVFTGKTVLGGVQQDSLFFDATNRTQKVIPGAVKLHLFSDGMAIIENSAHRFGYIDDRGGIAYDYQFEDAEDFRNGKAQVVQNYRKKTIEKKYAPAQSGANATQAAAQKTDVYTPGRIVQLGNYYGDITWIVLDRKDSNVLLISQNVLEYKSFHDYSYNKSASANWATCSLRNWLNGEFIRTAFSGGVSGKIRSTATGSGITDKVFLLSKAELETYRSLLTAEPKYTDHAQEARKKHTIVISTGYWLLRDSTGTSVVYSTTGRASSSVTTAGYLGVRPAMWISVDALP
ncbi:MAG: WG repeat-containing protein [Clostridia bacterium]|nr:WG repeat-containing protein [Clostridia bacterium]